MKSIYDACKEADGNESTWTIEGIARDLENQESRLPSDMVFAEVNGQPVGFGRVDSYQKATRARIYFTRGFVAAAWQRKGLGTAIVKHSKRRWALAAQAAATRRWVNEAKIAAAKAAVVKRSIQIEETKNENLHHG